MAILPKKSAGRFSAFTPLKRSLVSGGDTQREKFFIARAAGWQPPTLHLSRPPGIFLI